MIAEQLIRSGQAYLQGVTSPAELLGMLSDSNDEKTKNYWQHVLIVEVDPNSGRVVAQPVQSWGSWITQEGSRKPVFEAETERPALAPIWLPTGGNPLLAQGFYGFPVYPIYDRHWSAFAQHPSGVRSFLAPRLDKTANVALNEGLLEQVSHQVHEAVKAYPTDDKVLGVMVLAICGEGSAFGFSPAPCEGRQLASSQLFAGHFICAETEVMLARIWEAKAKEGAEKGELAEGVCAFSGKRGRVISGDNKAWAWFTTTWQAPFPESFTDKDHVKRLAFSLEAYRDLTVGATLFNKLTKRLNYILNKQLFAPVDSAKGREGVMRGQAKGTIFGSAIVTPLLDSANLSPEDNQLFAYGIQQRLEARGSGARFFLTNLLGYEEFLPPELASDHFRLTSVYFSGDPTRADVHLHAVIEDLVPSVLKRVSELLDEVSAWARGFYSDAQAWLHQRMQSLPYMLVSAYGPGLLWQSLADVLQARALPWEAFVRGVAHRCGELSHNLPDNGLALRNEAVLYATFREFYFRYHDAFRLERRAMRPWRTLLDTIASAPVSDIEFEDVEELGFAAGYLVRQFSRQYYRAANEKDYLQHRVMTFGSDLTPDVIYRRALGRLPEYAARVKANLSEDFRQRLGVWLSSYPQMQAQVKRQKDEFMAAFWAGYNLGRSE